MELEATVESLRKDNAALRQQLQTATAARLHRTARTNMILVEGM